MLMTAEQAKGLNRKALNSVGLMTAEQVAENAALIRSIREMVREKEEALAESMRRRNAEQYRASQSSGYLSQREREAREDAVYHSTIAAIDRSHMKLPRPLPPGYFRQGRQFTRAAAVGPQCQCVCVNGVSMFVCQ